jgi:hypothetical protein
MSGAKLIDFMMNFIKNPCFIIIFGIIFNSLPSQILFQSIHHLNTIKWYHHTWSCTTRYINHLICLQSYLNFNHLSDKWKIKMYSRFRIFILLLYCIILYYIIIILLLYYILLVKLLLFYIFQYVPHELCEM